MIPLPQTTAGSFVMKSYLSSRNPSPSGSRMIRRGAPSVVFPAAGYAPFRSPGSSRNYLAGCSATVDHSSISTVGTIIRFWSAARQESPFGFSCKVGLKMGAMSTVTGLWPTRLWQMRLSSPAMTTDSNSEWAAIPCATPAQFSPSRCVGCGGRVENPRP